jgi:hypothetical protein
MYGSFFDVRLAFFDKLVVTLGLHGQLQLYKLRYSLTQQRYILQALHESYITSPSLATAVQIFYSYGPYVFVIEEDSYCNYHSASRLSFGFASGNALYQVTLYCAIYLR